MILTSASRVIKNVRWKILMSTQETADNGAEDRQGWPKQAYSVSKACINALTAVLAGENPGLLINSCCPGWVSTDMGKMVGSAPPKHPGKLRIGYDSTSL